MSLFSGIGGLDLGFTAEGFDVVWANEISGRAVESYRRAFGLQPVCADIDTVPISIIPRADVVVGGPPCQAFSLVGRRRADDARGRLVFKFQEVVAALRPRAFVMENVPGMAASRVDGRRLPELLAQEFVGMGYEVSLDTMIATDYLVPQRRRRLFMVGTLGARYTVPDPNEFARVCFGVDRADVSLGAREAIGDLGPCVAKGERAPYGSPPTAFFARLMRRAGLPDVSLHECPRMSETDRRFVGYIPPGGNYLDIPDSAATPRVLNFKRTGGRTTTYGRLHPERPAYTINTFFRRPNVGSHFHFEQPRLITVREAMRFQSLPDDFELVPGGAQDDRNALVGNAVPPLLARAVAWSLQRALAC